MHSDEIYVIEYHKPAPKLPLLRLEWRKVGGIRFWRIGRLGGSFYVSR